MSDCLAVCSVNIPQAYKCSTELNVPLVLLLLALRLFCYILKEDRYCACTCNIETRSRNFHCGGKAISITHSERASVALFTQHPKRMRHITLSSVASQTAPYFSTFSRKRQDFQERNLLNIKCMFWFPLQCVAREVAHKTLVDLYQETVDTLTLKPSCYFMYHQVSHLKVIRSAHTVYLCVS
jgi:hypothetical protein